MTNRNINFFRLTHGEGPIFEMHEVVEHNYLIQLIEKVFPEMTGKRQQEIYQNLLKCVEKREYVSNTNTIKYINVCASIAIKKLKLDD